MKPPQPVFYQLNFVVFILLELNRMFHPFLQIFLGIFCAKPWQLLAPMTVKYWHDKGVQLRNLKMTYTVFNWVVGLVLEKVVAFSIELWWICLSFTSFLFDYRLKGLRFVQKEIVLQENWVVWEGGFFHGFNDLKFKITVYIGR